MKTLRCLKIVQYTEKIVGTIGNQIVILQVILLLKCVSHDQKIRVLQPIQSNNLRRLFMWKCTLGCKQGLLEILIFCLLLSSMSPCQHPSSVSILCMMSQCWWHWWVYPTVTSQKVVASSSLIHIKKKKMLFHPKNYLNVIFASQDYRKSLKALCLHVWLYPVKENSPIILDLLLGCQDFRN